MHTYIAASKKHESCSVIINKNTDSTFSDVALENSSNLTAGPIQKISPDALYQYDLIAQNERLLNTLDNINTTLGGTPKNSLVEIIIGALFSVMAAFVFNMLYWYIIDHKKKLALSVESLKVIIGQLEKTSTEYWTHGCDIQCIKENKIQEMRIKSENRLLRQAIKKVIIAIKKKRLKEKTKSSLNEVTDELYDITTGDDFESPERKENLKKVGKIIKLCTQIKMEIAELSI